MLFVQRLTLFRNYAFSCGYHIVTQTLLSVDISLCGFVIMSFYLSTCSKCFFSSSSCWNNL